MRNHDLAQFSARALRGYPTRSLLMLLAMGIGVASVMLLIYFTFAERGRGRHLHRHRSGRDMSENLAARVSAICRKYGSLLRPFPGPPRSKVAGLHCDTRSDAIAAYHGAVGGDALGSNHPRSNVSSSSTRHSPPSAQHSKQAVTCCT